MTAEILSVVDFAYTQACQKEDVGILVQRQSPAPHTDPPSAYQLLSFRQVTTSPVQSCSLI
jgi:hypothetical protein